MSMANATDTEEMVWVSADGTRRPISTMATPHLRNAIAMVEREVPKHYLTKQRNAMPVYWAMKAELEARQQPRIVEAQGVGPFGRYIVQWKVEDGKLHVRHSRTSRSGYVSPRVFDSWKPTSTLTRSTLEKLIDLYDNPTSERA